MNSGACVAELITVTATARQALAMGRHPTAEATVPTHRHVPGSVLRGALAAAWLTEHGEPDPLQPGRARIPAGRRDAFIEIFEGRVRFGPLLAPGSYVVPLSVRRCKYPKPGHDCHRVALDAAFLDPTPDRCPACDGALEAGRGEVEQFDEELVTVSTRVALTEGETAQEGLLFARQALRSTAARPLTLTGPIAAVRGAIPDWLTAPRRVLLGGRRSTGGAVDLSTGPAVPQPPRVTDRIVLRLLSPAVLVDNAGRPARTPDAALLTDILGVRVEMSHHPGWTRLTTVGGWHAASNLPKPDELAVTAGSVFELLFPEGPPGPEALTALLVQGIGLRRAEGYGWIEIATTPWQPPAPAGKLGGADIHDNPAAKSARILFGSGQGRWLLDELRRFLDAWQAGPRPGPYLLNRRQLEEALHDHAFRQELTTLLDTGTPHRVRQVIDALETLIRGTR
jgi:CRISPR-associated protein Csx10